MVLFGGINLAGFYGDTWIWDGHGWREHLAPHTPAPRAYHGMVYHEGLGEVVLFGGINSGEALLSDTWSFDGVDWTNRSGPIRPTGGRHSFAFGYDPHRDRVVLFGGVRQQLDQPIASNEVWELDGNLWESSHWVGPEPPPSVYSAMAFHPEPRRMVALVQESFNGLSSVWQWDGSALGGGDWGGARGGKLGRGHHGLRRAPPAARAVRGVRLQ